MFLGESSDCTNLFDKVTVDEEKSSVVDSSKGQFSNGNLANRPGYL